MSNSIFTSNNIKFYVTTQGIYIIKIKHKCILIQESCKIREVGRDVFRFFLKLHHVNLKCLINFQYTKVNQLLIIAMLSCVLFEIHEHAIAHTQMYEQKGKLILTGALKSSVIIKLPFSVLQIRKQKLNGKSKYNTLK